MPNDTVPASASALPISTRKRMEDAIEKLIAALDAFDPDPDIEEDDAPEDDGCAEASLGATAHVNQSKAWAATRAAEMDNYDLEFDGETHACADSEPWLGAPHQFGAAFQPYWACGVADDREEECEDEGADVQSQPHDPEPDEPSLGSVAMHEDESQEGWSQGDHFYLDCEPDNRSPLDHEKARTRSSRTPSGIFTQPQQAAKAAMRELARVQRGGKPKPKEEPFKPYRCNGVLVIGRVR